MVDNEELAAIQSLHDHTAIYTAGAIVDKALARLDWPNGMRKMVDPSCGDGAFLVSALKRFLDAMPGEFSVLPSILQGWEIHYGAASEARERLTSMLVDAGCSPSSAMEIAAGMVIHGDFLKDGPNSPEVSYLVGNPPYIRWLNIPKLLQERYRAIVPKLAAADMLHAFIDRAVKCLKPGGQIVLVVADRVLLNANAAALREEVGRRVGISHVERLDVSSAFYRAKTRRAGTPPRIHPVLLMLSDLAGPAATVPLSREPVLLEGGGAKAAPGHSLGDVAEVRMAPWIGSRGCFLIPRAVAETLPAAHLVPVADTRALTSGVYQSSDWFAIRTEPDVAPPQVIQDHLRKARSKMCVRGQRPQAAEWLPPESWHNWDLSKPSLVIPRVAKTLRPILVSPGVLPISHAISIVVPESKRSALIKFLTSPEADAWLAAHGKRLENGYFSVSARSLRKMPVKLAEDDK